jgi:AbiV family abortive infection protein
LIRLARAAALNATGLIEDAEVLSSQGRWARSYALGVLALEEVGKFVLCVAASTWAAERADVFWTAFVTHETKLTYARTLLGIWGLEISTGTTAAIDTAVSSAPGEHQQKMRGLYVDLVDDTTISHPQTVSEEYARRMTADVRQFLNSLLQFAPDETPYQWAKEEYLSWNEPGEDPLAVAAPVFEVVVQIGDGARERARAQRQSRSVDSEHGPV